MMCLMVLQEVAAPITVPDNIVVWGNLSLAVIFNLLVTVLRTLGVIKDDTATKKFLGGFLAAVGGVVGLVYAFTTGVVEVVQIITLAAGGALAGLGSVGIYSTIKNTKEGVLLMKSSK